MEEKETSLSYNLLVVFVLIIVISVALSIGVVFLRWALTVQV